jgi:uncharacterized protein (UPF0261 family)
VRVTRTVVLVGALDTKGAEFRYVRDEIRRRGLRTVVIDFGVIGPPQLEPDIDRRAVVAAAGVEIERFATGEHKDEAMRAMAAGLAVVVRGLYEEGRLDGILGMGGSGGTSLAATAMRRLPVGVPKLMVSTVGGGNVSAFAGTTDITFMPSIVDVAGFNRISRRIFSNAAAAIAGMVLAEPAAIDDGRPVVAASMFGNTTPAVDRARRLLERKGFEVLVFHATGTGGRAMDELIATADVAGSLDLTTTELADEVCGGLYSAGPERCHAASRAGVPAVLAPGCVDMANFGAPDSVPERYRDRMLYAWNPDTTLLRTNVEENRRIGAMLAGAANEARAPVAFLLPLGGVSMLDAVGRPFWDPAADAACFEAIKANVRPGIPVVELPVNINDAAFGELAVATLLEMLGRTSPLARRAPVAAAATD